MTSPFDSDFAAISAALGGLSTTGQVGNGGGDPPGDGGAFSTSFGAGIDVNDDRGLGTNAPPVFFDGSAPTSEIGTSNESQRGTTTDRGSTTFAGADVQSGTSIDGGTTFTTRGTSTRSTFAGIGTGTGTSLGLWSNKQPVRPTPSTGPSIGVGGETGIVPSNLSNTGPNSSMAMFVPTGSTEIHPNSGPSSGMVPFGMLASGTNTTGHAFASTSSGARPHLDGAFALTGEQMVSGPRSMGDTIAVRHRDITRTSTATPFVSPHYHQGVGNETSTSGTGTGSGNVATEMDMGIPTNTNFGANRATGSTSGMSSDGSFFVVTGQQPSVFENPPRFATSPTAKYKIVKLSVGSAEKSDVCFGLINQGPTFCLERNCRTSHKGGRVTVEKDNLYVVKPSGKAAFLEPTVNSSHVEEKLLLTWLEEKLVLDEWTERFMVVKTSTDTVNEAVFKLGSVFAREAKTFKSPIKSETIVGSDEDLDTIPSPISDMVDRYTPRIENVETFIEKKGSAANFLSRVVSGTERTLAALTEAFQNLQVTSGEMFKRVNVEIPVLFAKQENLEAIIGKRVVGMDPAFEAPTIWSSISLLSGYVGELASSVKTLSNQCESAQKMRLTIDGMYSSVKGEFHAIEARFGSALKEECKMVDTRLTSLRTQLLQSFHDIVKRLNQDKAFLDETASKLQDLAAILPGHDANSAVLGSNGSVELNELRQELIQVNAKVDEFLAENDREAVKFGNLGLKRFPEAAAFLDTVFNPHSDYNFALIVDAHIVFEHIYVVTNETNSLSRLQLANKVKLDSLSQGIAFTSFDKRIPRIFAADENIRSKGDESFFDKITSYRDWNAPQSGTRDYMKRLLNEFVVAHKRLIREHPACSPGTTLFVLASEALLTSIAWIQHFFIFIDDTYNELTRNKYSAAQGWSLVTRLACRILRDVSVHREGVNNRFKVGDNENTCKLIFWAVIQTHDLMERFKSLDFINDPAISAEYVRFLIMNNGMESVDALVSKNATLEQKVATLTKAVTDATTSAKTASNQVTALKDQMKELSKKVDKANK